MTALDWFEKRARVVLDRAIHRQRQSPEIKKGIETATPMPITCKGPE
jgi:hypothetical protein